MKYRKITAVILAVATAICAAGCNGNDNSGTSSSGDVTSSGSGDSSMTTDNTTSGGNSGTPQAQFTFSQVAMGGGGFVSGVFAMSNIDLTNDQMVRVFVRNNRKQLSDYNIFDFAALFGGNFYL